VEQLLQRIQQLLREKLEVNAVFEDGDLFFLGKCGPVTARISITATESVLTVCGHFPVFANASRRPAACEALALINWGQFAHFALDTDGEIVCIAQLVLYDATPTDKQISRVVYQVWSSLERFAAPLVEILTTQSDPALTLARAKQSRTQAAVIPVRTTDVTIN
jgi:hypothetical protein